MVHAYVVWVGGKTGLKQSLKNARQPAPPTRRPRISRLGLLQISLMLETWFDSEKDQKSFLEWQGVDTIIVAAGVSALQPLMAVAGVEADAGGASFTPSQASEESLQRAVDISGAAARGNYTGPLVTAITFIPLLVSSSSAPSILLVSSLASVIPAPRTLYASTKAASQHGLKREDVAGRCIEAVERMVKAMIVEKPSIASTSSSSTLNAERMVKARMEKPFIA
ncbi:hypothetical protein H0H92_003816 [Tricholoma furcatifolium]|nr:hypothetical protein H0H92_003816 [Tricholoma furcatifolium]